MTDFMKSRNLEEYMAEDRHLWRLGVDGQLLALYISGKVTLDSLLILGALYLELLSPIFFGSIHYPFLIFFCVHVAML